MTWFTGLVVYVLVWWTVLFAVLPLWTRPVASPERPEHFPGAPERPLLWRKIVLTTVISALVWGVIWLVVESGVISFRDPA
ncbi:DUF1467 family protein [Elioraea thermophila]|uniref:DUF1467 family protein n=1 Tax=Elioraea thermophila TaxID=2185104 RepID=UPI000DF18F82|nr:DUF1467 family protein [Elioraea thermophila]